jgi:hypothetical protein
MVFDLRTERSNRVVKKESRQSDRYGLVSQLVNGS